MWVGLAALAGGPACDQVLLSDGSSTDGGAAITTPVSRESHAAFFPIGVGTFHADLACGDCHAEAETFQQFTCVSCHAHDRDAAAARHTFITGYEWESSACRTCHPAGQEAVISRADHSAKYFGIATGSHATFECGACHPFKTTSKTFTCTSCHTQTGPGATDHTAIPAFRYDSFACYGCHPGH